MFVVGVAGVAGAVVVDVVVGAAFPAIIAHSICQFDRIHNFTYYIAQPLYETAMIILPHDCGNVRHAAT